MRNNYYTQIIEPIISQSDYLLIIQLQHIGLLKQYNYCLVCNNFLELKPYTRNKDKYAFRCMKTDCRNYKKYISIRKNSIFESFRFNLRIGIILLWKWLGTSTQEEILREVDVDAQVLSNFFSLIRKTCAIYFTRNPVRLGGEGVICQIDESLFRHKPKNHVGRYPENEVWVFGIADTSYTPSRVYMQVVPNRTAATLLPIITEICRTGTIIYSDQWRAYNGIYLQGFIHNTVNHSLHFVDPETQVHTQNIESYWGKVKSRIKKMNGINGAKIQDYIFEWMWKDIIYQKEWQNIVDLIKIYFD